MRLSRLTGLEMEKLNTELREVQEKIKGLRKILDDRGLRMEIISDELSYVAEKYGDDRRSEIIGGAGSLVEEDLIADEEMVITFSHQGYLKRTEIDTYRAQRRGGRGLMGMGTKDEDWVEHVFLASAHQYLMIFTRSGKCHWLKVWQIPSAKRHSRGKSIVNLLNIDPNDEIASVVPVREFSEDRYLMFCTKGGRTKKTPLAAYGNVRSVGLNAITISDGDELMDVRITGGSNEVILATRNGKAIRFNETRVRSMGRTAAGVLGVRLDKGDKVVGMVVVDQLMFITRNGVINRQPVDQIGVIGRATQGVRLVNLDDGDVVMDVARIIQDEDPIEDE